MRLNKWIWIFVLASFTLSSCGMLRNMFRRKSGCPSNGKNIGAERIASGDPKAIQSAKRAKKFKN